MEVLSIINTLSIPMNNKPFRKVWRNLLKEGNIEKLIKLHIDERKPFLDLVQKYVECLKNRGSVNILEIGCGTAIDSYYIAQVTGANVWAIDISPESIRFAESLKKHFNREINLKVGDVTKMDFENNSFDLIFSQGTMEHFKNPMPVMKEQVRLLCNNGYLIVDVPQKYNIYAVYRRLMIAMNRWPYGWETGYSISGLRRLGKRSGLKIIDTIARGVNSEFNKSRRLYIAIFGRLYSLFMRDIDKISHKLSIHFLENISVVYVKEI